MTDKSRTRTHITQYDTTLIEFRSLEKKYPTGEYIELEDCGTEWFNVHVMGVKFTWFLE